MLTDSFSRVIKTDIFVITTMREVSKQFSKKTKSGTIAAAAAAKSLQSCPTLCDPMDSSPPGSPVHGILQARTLEWVAISLSGTIAIYQEIGCGM